MLIRQVLNAACRMAISAGMFSIFVVWCEAPASAGTIHCAELNSANDSLSLDLGSVDQAYGRVSIISGGCVSAAPNFETLEDLEWPEIPSNHLIPRALFLDLVTNAASSGIGTSSGSSSGSSGASSAQAILCWIVRLPQASLIGRVCSAHDLDMPAAPPFELLRPPMCLATVACVCISDALQPVEVRCLGKEPLCSLGSIWNHIRRKHASHSIFSNRLHCAYVLDCLLGSQHRSLWRI